MEASQVCARTSSLNPRCCDSTENVEGGCDLLFYTFVLVSRIA